MEETVRTGLLAKLVCENVHRIDNSEVIVLRAVSTTDPEDPNRHWAADTPYAELWMTIDNPRAQGEIQLGRTYYLRIDEA